MKNLRSTLCASILGLGALSLAAGCSGSGSVEIDPGDPDPDASLTVINESDFVIEEIRLTEVNDPDWGPNLLGGDILLPDEHLTLGVSCGYYDALLVDEDGVTCELQSIDLCLNDATWYIRNSTCVAFEAALQARRAVEAAKAQSAGSGAQ